MKLCYILPVYDVRDATHFAHIHDLLTAIAPEVTLWLLIEKGGVPPPEIGYARVSLLRLPAPFRIGEYLVRRHARTECFQQPFDGVA